MLTIFILPFFITSTTFSFDSIPSPQIAGDSIFISIQASDPDDFGGIGVLSALPTPSFMEVPGNSNNRIQFNNGNWDGYVIVYTARDSLHLNCTEYGHSDINLSNEFSVDPDEPQRLAVLLPGEQMDPGNIEDRGRYGNPAPLTAGRDSIVRVLITDRWWNPSGFGSEQVSFSSDNPFPDLPDTTTTGSGYLSTLFNLRTARSNNHIIVNHASPGTDTLLSDTSSPVDVYPGSFTGLLLTVPGESRLPGDTLMAVTGNRYPGVSGQPSPQTSGQPFISTVYAVDNCWNTVTSAPSDIIRLYGIGFPSVNQTGALSGGSVQFNVMLNTGGVILTLQAEDTTDNSIEDSYTVPVRIYGSQYLVDVSPRQIVSGGTLDLTVVYTDAQGDTIVDANHPVHLKAFNAVNQSEHAQGYISPEDTIVRLRNGVGTSSVEYYTEESEQIVLRVRDSLSVTGWSQSIDVNVSAGGDEPLMCFPNPFGDDYQTINIHYYLNEDAEVKITIYDKFGNLVWKHSEQGNGGTEPNVVLWDGTNTDGDRVSSGIYFIYLKATDRTRTVAEYKKKIGIIR